MDVKATSSLELPEAFLDPSIYTASDTTPRYIRLKPGCEVYLEEIEAEIKCKLEKVAWLPNFYYFPPQIQIANSKAYLDGKIYGIDAASGAAVTALDICLGDHVLDLCASPGAKLCMISDLLGSSGSVTGAMSQDRDWQLVQLCCRNMHLEINVVCLLLMEQHFPLFLSGFTKILKHAINLY